MAPWPQTLVTSPHLGEITVSYVVEVVEGAVAIEGPEGSTLTEHSSSEQIGLSVVAHCLMRCTTSEAFA